MIDYKKLKEAFVEGVFLYDEVYEFNVNCYTSNCQCDKCVLYLQDICMSGLINGQFFEELKESNTELFL